ncbi:MAG: phosphoribosylformylglycinamidine cyclo-ligase [Candidatus Omnitrophica bacterium]|nr:phosphoribosylformylglycinamidine cyclo-ligase [Candidatus Omnitrophota bacterium]
MIMKKITYKQAGVDINAANSFKAKLQGLVKSSQGPEVLKGIGGFGSFFSLSKDKYRDPVLVSSSDGVGTKLKIASLCGKHDTIGIDAVGMNVNDILCVGAKTLFFLDYIAYSDLDENVLLDVVKGLNQGCLQAGCSLIGGETAQMPGMYAKGEYDLAGFCVGIVERDAVIDGSKIAPGNVIIGIESNGIHSNGYSLVRKVLSVNEQKRMGKELLKPTRIYVKQVQQLLNKFNRGRNKAINGLSHITGGSFYDKIARILPANVDVKINKGSWAVPQIFKLIQAKGNIPDKEIYHTLNMGIGMVVAAEANSAKDIQKELSDLKLKSWVIGTCVKGHKQVEIV